MAYQALYRFTSPVFSVNLFLSQRKKNSNVLCLNHMINLRRDHVTIYWKRLFVVSPRRSSCHHTVQKWIRYVLTIFLLMRVSLCLQMLYVRYNL